VGYVVIHADMMDKPWLEKTSELFSGIDGLRRLETPPGVVAFRVNVLK